MKAREVRFLGTGNTWVGNGHYRGWKIQCAGCGVVKTVSSHDGASMPPNVIIKKLLQSGWYIGHKPEDDVCVACRRKKPKKGNGADPKPHAEISIGSGDGVGDWFGQMRHCIALAKVAVGAKQFDRAARLLDVALRGLELKGAVCDVVWRKAVESTKAQREIDAVLAGVTPAAARPPPPPETPPPQNDDEYQRWLTELDKGKAK